MARLREKRLSPRPRIPRPCGAELPDGMQCQNMTANIGYCQACNDRHWLQQEAHAQEKQILDADARQYLAKRNELVKGGIHMDTKSNGNTGLVKAAPSVLTLQEIMPLAEVFAASGMFPTVKDKAQAAVKILAGRELGLDPIYSMTHVDVVQGQVRLRSEVMARLIKESGTADYRTLELTPAKCTIRFFRRRDQNDHLDYTYTLEDAQKAGLVKPASPWVTHPRVMLWNRAMSQGAKIFCPECLKGAVDAEDDGPTISFGSNITLEGETKAEICPPQADTRPAETPPCNTTTGEIVEGQIAETEAVPGQPLPEILAPSTYDRLQALAGTNWRAFQDEIRKRHNCLVAELPEELAQKYVTLLERKSAVAST